MPYIPENLRIYRRNFEMFTVYKSKETIKARKGFVVDLKSKKSHKTAIELCTPTNEQPVILDRFQMIFEEEPEVFEDVPNNPIKLRLIDIGHKRKTYKVITTTGYLYDFSEDTLMEVLTTVGMGENGHLNGEYVWAWMGSQMKLILVGGGTWAFLQKNNIRRQATKLENRNLEAGCVYMRRNGMKTLFLGWVHSIIAPNKKIGLWVNIRGYSSRWDSNSNTFKQIDLTVEEELQDHYSSSYIGNRTVISKISGPHIGVENKISEIRSKWVHTLLRSFEYYSDRYLNRGSSPSEFFLDKRNNHFFEHATITVLDKPVIVDPRLLVFFVSVPPK